MIKLRTVTLHLKKIQKMYKSRDKPLELCWHKHFSPEINNFIVSGNTDKITYGYIFSNSFDSYCVFIDGLIVLISMIAIMIA